MASGKRLLSYRGRGSGAGARQHLVLEQCGGVHNVTRLANLRDDETELNITSLSLTESRVGEHNREFYLSIPVMHDIVMHDNVIVMRVYAIFPIKIVMTLRPG